MRLIRTGKFLAFVVAEHCSTSVHRELAIEDDVKQLLATYEALAG
jgi:hypothetical protein